MGIRRFVIIPSKFLRVMTPTSSPVGVFLWRLGKNTFSWPVFPDKKQVNSGWVLSKSNFRLTCLKVQNKTPLFVCSALEFCKTNCTRKEFVSLWKFSTWLKMEKDTRAFYVLDEKHEYWQKRRKLTKKLVRVRFELTTLALSAPRSADWANGPRTQTQWTKGEVIFTRSQCSPLFLKWYIFLSFYCFSCDFKNCYKRWTC